MFTLSQLRAKQASSIHLTIVCTTYRASNISALIQSSRSTRLLPFCFVRCLGRTSRLYKTVFPKGLDAFATPSTSHVPSRKPSQLSLASAASSTVSSSSPTTPTGSGASTPKSAGLFGRFGGSFLGAPNHVAVVTPTAPDGPIEELIVSGVAFGEREPDHDSRSSTLTNFARLRALQSCFLSSAR